MNSLLRYSLLTLLVITCAFVAGGYLMKRLLEASSKDDWREVLIWGGGFIIYAVFDYFILMR